MTTTLQANAEKIAFALDDKPAFRRIYVDALIKLGFQRENIFEFGNGWDASMVLRDKKCPSPPAVIITDNEMDSCGEGLEFAGRVKEKFAPEAKILLCSASLGTATDRAKKAGIIDAVFEKSSMGDVALAVAELENGKTPENSIYYAGAVQQIANAALAMQMGKVDSPRVG